jgi:hypothetical protein
MAKLGSKKDKDSGVVRPHWLWFLVLDGGIWMLVQLVVNRELYEKARAKTDNRLPPHATLQGLLAGTAVVHVGEALVAGRMASRRGLPRRGWMVQTFIVGFPSLSALRKAG